MLENSIVVIPKNIVDALNIEVNDYVRMQIVEVIKSNVPIQKKTKKK